MKRNNDFESIKNEFLSLYMNFSKYEMVSKITYVTPHNVKIDGEDCNVIGVTSDRINKSNYNEIVETTIENEKYHILFNDLSYINMLYYFNNNNELVYSSVSYVPYDNGDDPFTNMSKYVRIDFEKKGYVETFHPYSHIHFSVYKNDFRMPVDHVFTPIEFVNFIMLYFYKKEIDKKYLNIDKITLLSCKPLSVKEDSRFKVSFSGFKEK